MKKLIAFLLLCCSLSFGQAPQSQISLTLLNPPVAPTIAGPPFLVGLLSGPAVYYFWLVSEFPIGNSTPSGPFICSNAQPTLSGSNYCVVTWNPVPGASSYDLLMTTTPNVPTGACGCAVVTATNTLTQNVQSNSLNAYTVTTFNPSSVQVILDNEALGSAGVSSLFMRQGPSLTLFGLPDSEFEILPSDCSMFLTAGAWAANSAGAGGLTGPAMVRIAANNWILQGITTAAANSIGLSCDVNPMTRTTAGHGAQITGIQLFYGVQTTALTSITPPTLSTVTYPATGASAGVTVSGAGGSLTVTPGTLQLATTTSGQCYSENISLGTPVLLNSKLQRLTLEQIFNQTAAAATQLQFCGAIVYYTYYPF